MSKMRMPGLTAEASSYRSTRSYRAGSRGSASDAGEVVPSLPSDLPTERCYDLGHAYCCCGAGECCCSDYDTNDFFCWPHTPIGRKMKMRM